MASRKWRYGGVVTFEDGAVFHERYTPDGLIGGVLRDAEMEEVAVFPCRWRSHDTLVKACGVMLGIVATDAKLDPLGRLGLGKDRGAELRIKE